ncbi:peptide chain release factor N(5)-glutamine methyltransferase [Haloimpatiens lingqiaonensis]|uniref:peptide chain release factor N(5)-glutamine methyltransferase n=1 Tax=Haloimpatiens lingqiaonensis TaxID=1380675 RepID=UPI0010FE5870|nr:peptide chain release factor N(5)-glutamine methyltransferase [Haloimpatiens lingqiaonensis]
MKIRDILPRAYELLKEEQIDTYMLDAQLLLCKVLNKDKLFLIMNRDLELNSHEQEEFFKYINMRKNKMPVKYILGQCEFMGMNFFIREGVLIPRPDTEILVENVLEIINKNKFKNVLDICCGSGAIGVSIGNIIKDSNVICSDISDVAKMVTTENIKRFSLEKRVQFIQSDLFNFTKHGEYKFDIIVSNPPYIEEHVIPTLMEDVKEYEPYIALCGGKDGLDFYRKIVEEGKKLLVESGVIAFEIGYNQKDAVTEIFKNNGFKEVVCFKDLAGLDRVVIGKI